MLNGRIKVLLFFSIFLGLFLLNTNYTDADIFAERDVRSNLLSAATLNFFARSSVNNSSVSYLFKTVGILPGGYDFAALKIKRDGNVNFKYHLRSKKTNGDDTFCQSLSVQVLKRDLTTVYSGKLMALSVDASVSDNNSQDWIFLLSLDQNDVGLENKICEFNLDFKTFRSSPNETGGIYAQRILTNVISSGSW